MHGSLPVLLLDAQLVLQLLHGGAQLLRGRLELDQADLRLQGAVIGSLREEEGGGNKRVGGGVDNIYVWCILLEDNSFP